MLFRSQINIMTPDESAQKQNEERDTLRALFMARLDVVEEVRPRADVEEAEAAQPVGLVHLEVEDDGRHGQSSP